MVLEETGTSMSRPLRDRGARNTNRALHLSRSIKEQHWNAVALRRNLQVNRVALELVVQSGSLNPEEFGCFFLVPAAFGERLKNCVPLQVVESLHPLAGQPAEFGLLQRRRQLDFCRQLFDADRALPG